MGAKDLIAIGEADCALARMRLMEQQPEQRARCARSSRRNSILARFHDRWRCGRSDPLRRIRRNGSGEQARQMSLCRIGAIFVVNPKPFPSSDPRAENMTADGVSFRGQTPCMDPRALAAITWT